MNDASAAQLVAQWNQYASFLKGFVETPNHLLESDAHLLIDAVLLVLHKVSVNSQSPDESADSTGKHRKVEDWCCQFLKYITGGPCQHPDWLDGTWSVLGMDSYHVCRFRLIDTIDALIDGLRRERCGASKNNSVTEDSTLEDGCFEVSTSILKSEIHLNSAMYSFFEELALHIPTTNSSLAFEFARALIDRCVSCGKWMLPVKCLSRNLIPTLCCRWPELTKTLASPILKALEMRPLLTAIEPSFVAKNTRRPPNYDVCVESGEEEICHKWNCMKRRTVTSFHDVSSIVDAEICAALSQITPLFEQLLYCCVNNLEVHRIVEDQLWDIIFAGGSTTAPLSLLRLLHHGLQSEDYQKIRLSAKRCNYVHCPVEDDALKFLLNRMRLRPSRTSFELLDEERKRLCAVSNSCPETVCGPERAIKYTSVPEITWRSIGSCEIWYHLALIESVLSIDNCDTSLGFVLWTHWPANDSACNAAFRCVRNKMSAFATSARGLFSSTVVVTLYQSICRSLCHPNEDQFDRRIVARFALHILIAMTVIVPEPAKWLDCCLTFDKSQFLANVGGDEEEYFNAESSACIFRWLYALISYGTTRSSSPAHFATSLLQYSSALVEREFECGQGADALLMYRKLLCPLHELQSSDDIEAELNEALHKAIEWGTRWELDHSV